LKEKPFLENKRIYNLQKKENYVKISLLSEKCNLDDKLCASKLGG